jgi:1-acyl-sn-glycerol-3-phosphate acyltransferase
MLYNIFKPAMKAAFHLYFGRIEVNGLEHIDNGKPTLILANHTASFMDAMITACFVRRRIYFFTRGDVFRNPMLDKILRSLGMLPVYRMVDGRDKLQLNDSSNDEALRILGEGGAVLIFAEGASDIAKVLKPLKKGPFRLAVRAASTLPDAPMLVPMGINYVTPVHPFGDVFLNASPPISAAGFPAPTDSDTARAATNMMRALDAALRPLAWHIESGDHVHAGDALLYLLKHIKPDYTFADTQRLLHRLNEIRTVPEDWQVLPHSPNYGRPGIAQWVVLILLSPIALVGFIFNYPPVRLAEYVADTKVREPDFRAPVFLSLAVVLVVLWYLLWLIAGSIFWHIGPVGTLLAITVFSGTFFLKWYRPRFEYASGRRTRRLDHKNGQDIAGSEQSPIQFIRTALAP